MAAGNAIWGIDIGQCALKAVKVRSADDGKIELLGFDLIEHAKLLSQPDADAEELIRSALEKFASRNEWQGDKFVVGVPGQQTFARFCKLPPVEPRKIPDIVKFEAGQQIPFDMDDVVWDYQVFQVKDMPDVEVGIFAMRKDLIRKTLDYFAPMRVSPMAVQTIPSALYNFVRYEMSDMAEATGVVVVDVGAQNTDLIIVEPNSAWTRNIPLGGNAFTEALVKSFKLSFSKAETLKRTAASSKYARQIFQAMRPIFADLVAEIQRSLGFYSSTHREVELKSVLACGNAFLLPGLLKYLENNLSIGNVQKLEKLNTLVTSGTANAANFSDNILSFGAAYGLAIQGLGSGKITANLLPQELARVALWRKKRPAFVAAAACLGIASSLPWVRASLDQSALASTAELGDRAKVIVDQAERKNREFGEVSGASEEKQKKIEQLFELPKDRALTPLLLKLVHEKLPKPSDAALEAAQTPAELKKLIQSNPGRFDRTKRWQVVVDAITVKFAPNIDTLPRTDVRVEQSGVTGGVSTPRREGGFADPRSGGSSEEMIGGGGGGDEEGAASDAAAPGFYVSIAGRLLGGTAQSEAASFLSGTLADGFLDINKMEGLGFYLPETDELSPDIRTKKNIYASTPRLFTAGRAAPAPGPALARQPGVAPQPGEEIPAEYRDPVTGEDMRTDWEFSLGFKVKLGEAPKPEKTEGASEGAAAEPE